MTWCLTLKTNGSRLNDSLFPDKKSVIAFKERLSESIQPYIEVKYFSHDENITRMVNEGMMQGDLYRILLPKISIDEYVPADSNTDNIVLAFFVKGVPEAIIPFKEFCLKCDGVVDVDYGDSETIPSTTVVYLEFNRENENIKNIEELVEFVSMLADLEPEDFTITFPDTESKFPYDPKVVEKYFTRRDKQKNKEAQQAALDNSNNDDEEGEEDNDVPEGMTKRVDTQESLITRLSNIKIGDF